MEDALPEMVFGDREVTDPRYADPFDWPDNRLLGYGTVERTQLDDALALLELAKQHNPAQDIIVTGQSLGGGLAALVTAIHNARNTQPQDQIEGFAIAEAPFFLQLRVEASLLAIERILDLSRDDILGREGAGWVGGEIVDESGRSWWFDLREALVDGGEYLERLIQLNAPGASVQDVEDIIVTRSAILENFDQVPGLTSFRIAGEVLDWPSPFLGIDDLPLRVDVGSGSMTAKHGPALHNLIARTYGSESVKDFAALLRSDFALRNAVLDQIAILAPIGKNRADPADSPSRMSAAGPDASAFFNLLWKTVGTEDGFYSYFYDVFDKLLGSGATGNGEGAERTTIYSIHEALAKLALGIIRTSLDNTSTVVDFRGNLQARLGNSSDAALFFAGSEQGEKLTDRVVLDARAIDSSGQYNAPDGSGTVHPFIDEFGRAHGVTDISAALTRQALGGLTPHERDFIEAFLDRVIISMQGGGMVSGAEALPDWNILVAQAGSDKGVLVHDALTFDNGRYKELAHLIIGGEGSDTLAGAKGNDFIFAGKGNDTVFGGEGKDLLIGEAGNDTLQGGAGKDLLLGGEGNDTFIALPGMNSPGAPNGGDDDDTYIGGSARQTRWSEWIRGQRGADEIDTIEYRSGAQSPDPFVLDGEGQRQPVEPVETRLGLVVERLENVGSGSGKHVEIVVRDAETNRTSGTDVLVSIEQVKLTDKPDEIRITDASLGVEIVVDMGTSRRTQSELETGDSLDDGAFLHNLDIADYSAVKHGLIYYEGKTAERGQGLLSQSGATQIKGLEAETNLIYGKTEADALQIKGADKIILTDKDDVLIDATYGSIVELGDGQDKVWLRPGLLVQGFDSDDRLTLFGSFTLYGGTHKAGSEFPYAIGAYGIGYGLNDEGDLLVINPWMIRADGSDIHMYIDGWANTRDGSGVGAGDIALIDVNISVSKLLDERPDMAGEIDLWCLQTIYLRGLIGSAAGETSDPLILDLDGDGVELVWRTGSSASFDIDYDLYEERTAWASRDDGVLARDLNGNGRRDCQDFRVRAAG